MKETSNIFEREAHAKFARTAFNLSYEKKFTCDLGQLIPVMADEAVPADIWEIGNTAVVRFQPLLAPIMQTVNMRTYYFFVPFRILDDDWEEFITRGVTGDSVKVLPLFNPADAGTPANVTAEGTLWDYLGFPTGITPPPQGCPIDYPRRAYLMIWNEYFRDQNLQTELDITDIENHLILNRNWDRGYFVSALPFQQRGTPPALPVFGTGNADFLTPPYANLSAFNQDTIRFPAVGSTHAPTPDELAVVGGSVAAAGPNSVGFVDDETSFDRYFKYLTDNNTIAGSSFTGVDIADLRLAWQLQVWMERNARAGARYVEYLDIHFGVSPNDARLQRPEFIGGSSDTMITSEVLQTSEDGTTPQGTMKGHGIGIQSGHIGKYRVEEFGVIIGLMAVTPKPSYQDGVNRQWLRRTTFDYLSPEFVNLSEQEVFNGELIMKDVSADPTGSFARGVFGYTGIYNEMRYKPNLVCGEMRTTFDFWHIGRQFNPASPPTLNAAFVDCVPRKDFLAVPAEPAMIVAFGNHLNALRPLPFQAIPSTLGG